MHKVPNTSFPHTNRKVSVWGRLTEDALQIYHKEKRPRLLANSFPICTQISYAALLEISRKMNFAITATCHNSYTYIIFMIALQLQRFFYPNR